MSMSHDSSRGPFFESLEPRLLLDGTLYTVDSLADVVAADGVVTLREAIAAADSNAAVTADVLAGSATETDRITFDQAALQAEAGVGNPLVIVLGGTELTISDDVDIVGLGAETLTVDAGEASRVLGITGSDVEVTLGGLTITGGRTASGYDGGGIYNSGGTLTLTDVTVSGNTASSSGEGGGIWNSYGQLTLTNVTVSGNTAGWGGGIYNYSGTLSLTDVTVSGNTGQCAGGVCSWYGTLTLTDVTVSGNTAYGGGGIFSAYGTWTLTNVTVSGNTAFGSDMEGGGIWNILGTWTLTNVMVSGNTAGYGGGICNEAGTLTLTNATVAGNAVSEEGGGIYNDSYDPSGVTLNNSIVALNTAGGGDQDVRGGFNGRRTLIGIDPGFVRNPSAGPDGVWGTADDDYGDLNPLRSGAAVDAGDNSLLPADSLDLDDDGDTTEPLPIDLAGNPRVLYGTVDIGAYEGNFTPMVVEAAIVAYTPQQVIRVAFSEDMDAGTFDPAEDVLSFVGPGQAYVLGHVWQNDRTLDLYCLFGAYGDYTLTLSPGMQSLDGEWMDADGDGICGEADEDNSVLAVMMTPPYVVSHEVADGMPVDTVTVTFDRPMRATGFAPADDVIRFTGPAGDVSVDSWRWLNERTLELQVNCSMAGDYALVLASSIPDRSGAALDNDGDLVPGEPGEDDYSIPFRIEPPSVTGFIPPALPPVTGVTIHFSRPMDTATFDPATDVLSFTGPAGDVNLEAFTWLDAQTLRLSIEDAGTGTYVFELGTSIADAWGNALAGGYAGSFTSGAHGTISNDTTIGGEGAVVVIDGDLRIASGATLTIAPGTIIKFSGTSAGLDVQGNLEAVGTPDAPITFTSWRDDTVAGDTNGDGDATAPGPG
ncbi:MAG TPA: Ig-like domain-containing protein, partial [Phycisphaerae bacterium]|nr:Ig-like domain-containing protein [Phycisphaerae bacterium]